MISYKEIAQDFFNKCISLGFLKVSHYAQYNPAQYLVIVQTASLKNIIIVSISNFLTGLNHTKEHTKNAESPQALPLPETWTWTPLLQACVWMVFYADYTTI